MRLEHKVKQENGVWTVYTDTYADGFPGPVTRYIAISEHYAVLKQKELNEKEYLIRQGWDGTKWIQA